MENNDRSIDYLHNYGASPSMTNPFYSAKICGSITLRHSEKEGNGMNVELLLLLVPIAESSVVLPSVSPSLTNTIPAGLVEGFVEGPIDRGKVVQRCSFTCKSYLCTVAA